MQYRRRIKTLKERLPKERLDGILVNKKENIAYLCGFEGDNSMLVITSEDRDYIITDSRFKEKAEEKLIDFNIRLIDGTRYAVINDVVKRSKIKRVGFESDWLTYSDFLCLKNRLKNVRLIPKKDLVEDLRIIKDYQEIALIRRSISIAKKAYSYAKEKVKSRLNGVRLAALIDDCMRRYGASRSAFQTIVTQNPYSSHPHGPSTDTSFGKDCVVLVDLGAVFKGYNSDLTRIIFLGRISTKFKHIYNILKVCQNKAFEKIKPGIKISEIDKAARQHITNKGLKSYFLHSLGHGVGLEIHEPPKISIKSKGVLRPGMVFTIEPGIYIKGWGGLRLEDMVLVTKDGCEVLTDDIPK